MGKVIYGTARLVNGKWLIKCEAHVRIRLKRTFGKIARDAYDEIRIADSRENCRELAWFCQRFPLDVEPREHMEREAALHEEAEQLLADILSGHVQPISFDLALPLRDYQRVAADLTLKTGGLLLADDVGLGKTPTAIGVLSDQGSLPAVVVCPTHIQRQWEREIHRFAPALTTHIAKKTEPYDIKGGQPNVLIITYHKLHGWAGVLREKVRAVVFDEVHELRRGTESRKGSAASAVAHAVAIRLGLTATPIFNYGDEMHAIMEVLRPGALGEFDEFQREWMGWTGGVKDPKAFGAYLRREGLMLRRTREEVGRDLAPLVKAVEWIDVDLDLLDELASSADELALAIMQGRTKKLTTREEHGEQWGYEREFDRLLRQITGIAKAPLIAEMVRMLASKGERVVVYAWHREVYKILLERLAEFSPAMYTGSESPAKKDRELQRFCGGDAQVLLISLRSGAGLDGLQHHCRNVVFAELDWSPAQLEQCEGRVRRDGQIDQVTAYYPVATAGADPFMAERLGLKRAQLEGIRDPDGAAVPHHDATGVNVRALAQAYLEQRRGMVTPDNHGAEQDGQGSTEPAADLDAIFQVPAAAEEAGSPGSPQLGFDL